MINKCNNYNCRHNISTVKVYKTSLGNIGNSNCTSRSSSGVKGVYIRRNNRYEVRISIDGKETSFGRFSDFYEAIRLRKRLEEMYYKPIIDEAKKNGHFKEK